MVVDEHSSSVVISCGVTDVTINEDEVIEKNELKSEDIKLMKQVSSIPFAVEFTKPVCKVVCGDLFSALLTATGHVYSWGHNSYG